MRKLATVLALSLAATHGLPTPRGSAIAKKDEAKDDAPRFLRGDISKDIDEVNAGRKPLMGSMVPPFVGIGSPELTCGPACNWARDANCEDKSPECTFWTDGWLHDRCWSENWANVNCRKTCGYCGGDKGTCGGRVDYLRDKKFTVAEACAQVAEEFPVECGSCSQCQPMKCKNIVSVPTWVNLKEAYDPDTVPPHVVNSLKSGGYCHDPEKLDGTWCHQKWYFYEGVTFKEPFISDPSNLLEIEDPGLSEKEVIFLAQDMGAMWFQHTAKAGKGVIKFAFDTKSVSSQGSLSKEKCPWVKDTATGTTGSILAPDLFFDWEKSVNVPSGIPIPNTCEEYELKLTHDEVGRACPKSYCSSNGYKEDVCSCGVCGSYGSCTWSCDPGPRGENVPDVDKEGFNFKICDPLKTGLYVLSNGFVQPTGKRSDFWLPDVFRNDLISGIEDDMSLCTSLFNRAVTDTELKDVYNDLKPDPKQDFIETLVMSGLTLGLGIIGGGGVALFDLGEWIQEVADDNAIKALIDGPVHDLLNRCARTEACRDRYRDFGAAAAQGLLDFELGKSEGVVEQNIDILAALDQIQTRQTSLQENELRQMPNTQLEALRLSYKPEVAKIPGNTCNYDAMKAEAEAALYFAKFLRAVGPSEPCSAGNPYCTIQFGLCKDKKPCTKNVASFGVGTSYKCGVDMNKDVNLQDQFADGWVKYAAAVAKKFDGDWQDTSCN